jgi:hypothetical protein
MIRNACLENRILNNKPEAEMLIISKYLHPFFSRFLPVLNSEKIHVPVYFLSRIRAVYSCLSGENLFQKILS